MSKELINKKGGSSNTFLLVFFGILLLSVCFGNVRIFSFAGGFLSSINLHHLVSLIALPLLLLNGKIVLPNIWILILFGLKILTTLLNAPQWGISLNALESLIFLYVLVLVLTLGKQISFEQWQSLLRVVGVVILISVYVNLLLNFDEVVNSIRGHNPRIQYIFNGGPNIEASYLAMFSVFFLKKRWGYLYFANSVFISALYASRAGLIICLMCLAWRIFHGKRLKSNIIIAALSIVGFATIFTILATNTYIFSHLLWRFGNIGNEPGSVARLELWSHAWQTFINNPFGSGVGNAINAMSLTSGQLFVEHNMHNLYIQMLLDVGIMGFLIFTVIVGLFFYRESVDRFRNPFAFVLGIYFTIGMIQFTGNEVIISLLLGIYLSTRAKFNQTLENIIYEPTDIETVGSAEY